MTMTPNGDNADESNVAKDVQHDPAPLGAVEAPQAHAPDALQTQQINDTPPSYAPAMPAAASTAPSAGSHNPHAFAEPGHAPAPATHRSGGLVAGIAIGAIIGGLVGGGAAAVVASNVSGETVVQSTGGTLTLNNTDSATAVSGVAAVGTPSVVTLQVTSDGGSGSGSGVVYTADGYIITNAHVATLAGATSNPEIRVRMSDGTLYDGTLVGSDPFADIAVVKIDGDNLSPIAIADSEGINVGDTAVAIGAPLNLSNTVTSGVVSALNRGISIQSSMVPESAGDGLSNEKPDEGDGFPWDFRFDTPQDEAQPQQPQQSAWGSRVAVPVLQTDASINPGNSGGALLNTNAELIGINVALASNDTSDTAGSDGLGFAIPSNLAVRVADALIAGEQPSHGLLGVNVQESRQDTDADARREGGLIAEIVRGGAADTAGLRVGDVITAINGVPVNSSTAVSAMIRLHEGGSEVEVTYSRDGKLSETTVTLGTLEW